MIYSKLRFFLIFLFFALGILLHVQLGFKSAWYLYAASALLLLTYLLFGNISAAFVNLRKGKLEAADKLIQQVFRPAWLIKGHRAYYHFIKGMIALQKKEMETGEHHLKAALTTGLRTDTDKALIAINLAHITFVSGRRDESMKHLQVAKSFESNDLMIKENITKMERALAARYN